MTPDVSCCELLSSDAYSSVKYIRLMALEKQEAQLMKSKKKLAKKETQTLSQIQKEIATLKPFLNDAKRQRSAIKAEICMFSFLSFY